MPENDTYANDLMARIDAATDTDEKKRLTLYLPEALYDRLKTFSKTRGFTMNRAAIIALETMLDHAE